MIVFVSYSSTNREAVEALVLQLGELGHDVEYEVKFVGGPITWRHIFDSITKCDLFVTAVTRETLISSTCDLEYQYARSLNKNILAVLLEDLSTEDLPNIKVKGLVDFRIPTTEAQAALVDAVAALPSPLPPPNIAPPSANWVEPLAALRKRIENLPRDAREQRAVVLNIKEFMERRESFEVARSLLELLAVQPELRQATIGEIAYIRDELARVRTSTRSARRRRSIVGAIGLSSLVALIAVIFSQLFFRYRADYNVNLSMTRTAESIAAEVIASEATDGTSITATPTLVATIELSSTSTAKQPVTAAQVVTSTATPQPSTNTPNEPASIAAPPPTRVVATRVPPTIIILPTSTPNPTQIPASATPVPPTRTPAPTSVPPSATPVPPTVAATAQPPNPPSLLPTVAAILTLPSIPTLLGLSSRGGVVEPTNETTGEVANIVPQTAYVGMTVEDTPLGLKVTNVGATARSAGVEVGDYVLAVDLDIVSTRAQFLETMQARNPFSRITLRVRRAGGINIITLVLGLNDFAVVPAKP